jgi:hypothetical protein
MQIPAMAKPLVLCISASVVAFCANPVGRVISSAPLDVNGIAAPARNFVPVSIGDEVTSKGAPAVVQFPDGSGVTLQPNSRLRIEGQPSNVSVRVLSGSAVYDLARTSIVHVVNSKGRTVTGAFARPMVPLTSQQGPDPLTAAVVYRGSRTPPPGTIVPGSSILVGTFVPATSIAGGAPIDPAIILPNGETINLTATTNSTTGAITYTVTSITTPVTLSNGTISTLTITSNPANGAGNGAGGLIGDIVTPPVPGAASGTSASEVTISTPAGAPVTNANQVLQNTINVGAQNAGVTAPSPSPVSSGQFSNSAS